MVTLNWLDGVRLGLPQIRRRRSITRVEALEPRMVLATDFGDAPDTGAGTGTGNYETSLANNGPRHTIVAGLFLGARVDGEADGTPNAKANGDDIGTDDEDGVVNPEADLRATAGTQPTITLRASNTTGTAATLSGWIDTNGDGTFDNATERAQLAVPTGTNNGLFTLTLPTVPVGFFGKTFARFRLSTDAAAGNATGLASDGEVEDYVVEVTTPTEWAVKTGGATKIGGRPNGGPSSNVTDRFGQSVARVGDIDGDGIFDFVVGASDANDDSPDSVVRVLLANADGSIKSTVQLKSGENGVPTLSPGVGFGESVTGLGDLDGDGVPEIAVGRFGDNGIGGGPNRRTGAVYVLFLKSDGTVKATTRIGNDETTGAIGPIVGNDSSFGRSLANLGDIDGDGVTDLAVGAMAGSPLHGGAVYLLFLNANGSVKASTRIANVNVGQSPEDLDQLTSSLANLDDLDGDGIPELAVGGSSGVGAAGTGVVYVLFLGANGSFKKATRISGGVGGVPKLGVRAASLANVGDLDGDGTSDLAVGALDYFEGIGGPVIPNDAVHILFLTRDGQVKGSSRIADGVNGGPALANFSYFGSAITSLGDIDGDGAVDLGVGAFYDLVAGERRGALHFLRLKPNVAPTDTTLSSTALNGLPANLPTGTEVGRFGTVDPNTANRFAYTLVAGTGADDNASFTISGDSLRTNIPVDPAVKSSYTVRVRTTDEGNLSFEKSFTITVSATNTAAPVLDNSGNPFAVLGVGGRQSVEMRQGTLVSEILARGSGGDPISDADAGAQTGIAITAFDASLGTFQYTLVSNNPAESDWKNLDADGAVSATSALLLPATARIRFVTARVPHHISGTGFLLLESKLATGLTFRAWDLTAGLSGGRGDSTANGGTNAFSTATETATVYFEARLWRSFNTNAQLNVYTLEAEFNALVGLPGYSDRSTSAFTGFTVLLSAVPDLPTAPLLRMYFGVQFNDNGTETDLGYRYLTTRADEATILENLGRADKRPTREGAYFRELGVNNGTAVLGYVYSTQQPGTSRMTQVYRTDAFEKPTRPGGTAEGSTPTSTKSQEQGDHVYTTNTAFEIVKQGTWRVEAIRGFVRELTPNPTAGPPAAVAPVASVVSGAAVTVTLPVVAEAVVIVGADERTSRTDGVARLIAVSRGVMAAPLAVAPPEANPCSSGAVAGNDEPEKELTLVLDEVFTDTHLLANLGFGS